MDCESSAQLRPSESHHTSKAKPPPFEHAEISMSAPHLPIAEGLLCVWSKVTSGPMLRVEVTCGHEIPLKSAHLFSRISYAVCFC